MAKIPVYQSQVGANVPSGLPMQDLGVASAPGRAMQGVAESVGKAGNQLLRLQEQRNLRVRNIKALNLNTEYSREVNDLTVKTQELEGSAAIGAYQNHQKALEDLGKKYDEGIDDEIVREQFNAFRAQTNESSLNLIARHESAQTKVATRTAIDNLVNTHTNMITANPDAGQVEKSLAFINAEIDVHYSGEIGQAMKDKAALEIRGNYMLSLGLKDAKTALAYLEDLKTSGKIDAQNYISLKGKLDQKNDENAIENFERIAETKGIGPNRAIAILASPTQRAKHFPGITQKQAMALTGIFEGRARWNDYLERQAKADRAEAVFSDIMTAFEAGDVAGANKILQSSGHLMNSSQRSWVTGYNNTVKAEGIIAEQGKLYTNIDNGTITSPQQLTAALNPLMNSGPKGIQAANAVKSYFNGRRVDDAQNYDLADRLYKNAYKSGAFQFESTPADFLVYLRETCQAGNIHGDAIVKKAKDLIGYVEEKWGPDKIYSPLRVMEQKGAFKKGGGDFNAKAQKAVDNGILADYRKKQQAKGIADLVAQGYDQATIDRARKAIVDDKNLGISDPTPEQIKKVIDASR